MIARTLPETMAGMPCDFSHRGSRVIVRGRAPWQAPQIGAGVGRMAREVTSKILDGINDLVIMAPIREGFISAYEPVTYATRLRVIGEALNDVRATAREYEKITPFADASEPILSPLDFKEIGNASGREKGGRDV